MAVKEAHDNVAWTDWPADIRSRKPKALERWRKDKKEAVRARQFAQFLFFAQWGAVKKAAYDRGIQVMGDIPIFVAHDSADVWAHPDLFRLKKDGTPEVVAGVPPDYFSATGQLWGNPIYRWDEMARARLRLVGRALPRHLRDGGPRAPRPLPRLRGLLGDPARARRPRSRGSG